MMWILAWAAAALGLWWLARATRRAGPAMRGWWSGRRRRLVEDALKHLVDRQHAGRHASLASLAGALKVPQARLLRPLAWMEARGLVASTGGTLRLTPEGERRGLEIVRAHRLWERYLADEARLPMNRLHRAAERAEHVLTRDEIDALDAHLGYPVRDPHGDPIPTAGGHVEPVGGRPLTDWPEGRPGDVVHVEDEPEALFRQVSALGLRPGVTVEVCGRERHQIVVEIDGVRHSVSPVIAASVQVAAPETTAFPPRGGVRLSELSDGAAAEVIVLDPTCRGLSRRRLLDLGLTPGARITAELRTAGGGPRAYRVRDTLIALRREQAASIWVRPLERARPGRRRGPGGETAPDAPQPGRGLR